MRVLVICDICNQIAEYQPENKMNEVSIQSAANKFVVGLDWDNEIKDNINEDFLTDLTESTSIKRTIDILVNDISKNIYAETSDFDICFTCKDCGDQIILNNFALL